jgi:alpha-tubulin suppressor-like RCC1 family protein
MSLPFIDYLLLTKGSAGAVGGPSPSLYLWGDNTYGQLGDNKSSSYHSWSQLSSGGSHTVAVRSDGTLWAWGDNAFGQVGDATTVDKNTPVMIDLSTSTWLSAYAGDNFSIALKANNTLWVWGDNTYGQLAQGNTISRSSPIQVGTSSWTALSAGSNHALAVTTNNITYAWGYNGNGQLGTGDNINKSSVTLVPSSIPDGYYSSYFNSAYLTAASNSAFSVGTSNFTIEFWLYVPASQANPTCTIITTGLVPNFAVALTNASAPYGILFYVASTSIATSVASLAANTWYHIACVRNMASSALIFINGVSSGAVGTLSGTGSAQPLFIGATDAALTSKVTGYISNIRFITGQALYSGGFTPSTTPLTSTTVGSTGAGAAGSITGSVALLTCQSATFIDNSPNNFSLTSVTPPTSTYLTIPLAPPSISSVQVAAGKNHSAAIDNSGKLYGWGDNTYGQISGNVYVSRSLPIQIGSSSWSAVAAGGSHTAAITSDGKLFTWGYDYQGQLGINRSNTASYWLTLVDGGNHTIALRNDYTLWTWGNNQYGQLGDGTTLSRSSPVQIGSNSWTIISGGNNYSAAIRSDGKLYTWGLNTSNQLGLNDSINRSSPVQVGTSSWTQVSAGDVHTLGIQKDTSLWAWGTNTAGMIGGAANTLGTSWTKIVSGDQHAIGLKTDGTLWSWGVNTNGQLGTGTVISRSNPVQLGTSTYLDIAAGLSHSLAVRSDGILFGWGLNTTAQAGSLSWTQVSVGASHTLMLRSDGMIYSYGGNSTGQIGDATIVNKSSPVQIGSSSWSVVSAGTNISAAIKGDSTLWVWGYNANGALGTNDTTNRTSPVQMTAASYNKGVFAYGSILVGASGSGQSVSIPSNPGVAANAAFTVEGWAKRSSIQTFNSIGSYTNASTSILRLGFGAVGVGSLTWAFGSYTYTTGTNTDANVFAAADTWFHFAITRDAGSATDNCSLYINGELIQTGTDTVARAVNLVGSYNGAPGQEWNGYISNFRFSSIVRYTGNFTPPTDAFTLDGSLTYLLIGQNANQITDNSSSFRSLTLNGGIAASSVNPYNQSGSAVSSFRQVSARDSIFGIGIDYKLYASGLNTSGQFGYNDTISRSAATQISTLSWTTISAGVNYTAGITTSNTLYAWGDNTYGQLGVIDTVSYSSPVQVAGSWSQVSAGPSFALAIDSASTLYAWGANNNYQLGLSDLIYRSSPTQVNSTSWSLVKAGINHALAVNTSNTLYGWGSNNQGQIGIITPLTFTSISGNAAEKANNTVWMWGANDSGQLGVLYTDNRSSPVQVSTDNWRSISATTSWTLGIKNDYTLWGWGKNDNGQLGLNDTIYRSSPVQIGTGSWSVISANLTGHALGITSTGLLYSWGLNDNGQLGLIDSITRSNPTQVTTGSWTQVSAGNSFSIALRSDGGLFRWGLNSSLQLGDNTTISRSSPVQFGTSSYSQVSAGSLSGYAIRASDSSLWAWGNNATGQIGTGTTAVNRSSPVQIGTSSWSLVSAGQGHVLGITTVNALWGWGLNATGQAGDNTTVTKSVPTIVLTGSSFTTVSASNSFSSAIGITGKLFTWGYNASGQLGQNDTINRSSPVQVGTDMEQLYSLPTQVTSGNLSTVTSIAAGGTHSTVISSTDGSAWNWGYNLTGQLGNTSTISRSSPSQVATATLSPARSSPVQIGTLSWSKVSATNSTSIAIRSNGTLYAWGDNTYGQVGDNAVTQRIVPTLVNTTGSFTQLSSGNEYTMAIKSDSTVWLWGRNDIGQLGQTDTINRSNPTQITGSYSIVSAGASTAYAIDTSSRLYGWGLGTSGQLLTALSSSTPSIIDASNSYTNVTAGSLHAVTVRPNNTVYVWGDNSSGQLNTGDTVTRSSAVQIGGSYTLLGNNRNITVLQSPGAAVSLGLNTNGQLGDGTIITRSSPVMIYAGMQTSYVTPTRHGFGSWSQVAAGYSHSVALNSSNLLFTWGFNTNGGLGSSDVISRSSPTQVTSITGSFTQITASKDTAAVIRNDSTMWVWGLNTIGQLGESTTFNRSIPVQIGTSSDDWLSVQVAPSHTVAVKQNNTVWAWGYNQYGVLGTSDNIDRSSPTQLGTLAYSILAAGTNNTSLINPYGDITVLGDNRYGQLGNNSLIYHSWIQLSNGNLHSLALRDDKTLWSWGSNSVGQIGDNSIVTKSSPVQVAGSWNSVSAGYSHNMAIKIDGTLWGWGLNTYGQTGSFDAINRSTPVQVGVDSDWSSVTTGLNTTFAIKNNGTLWGLGQGGYLGIIDVYNRSSPTQIGTNSWTSVSAGASHAVAIDSTNALYTWGNGASGQLGVINYISWVFAAGGGNTSFLIRDDGSLWSTAYGTSVSPPVAGMIGDNTSNVGGIRSSPSQIGTNTSWVMTATHRGELAPVAAIDYQGALYTWATNDSGQLGLGDTISRSSPTQVTSVNESWTSISVGHLIMAGITASNKLYMWGNDTYSALGQGTNVTGINRSDPTQITGSWAQVVASVSWVLARRTDGTVWAWGTNGNGQLGNNTQAINGRSSPVQVGAGILSSVVHINAGTSWGTAVKSDGTLWSWGSNNIGQLGLNDTINRSNPVQVTSLNVSWSQVKSTVSNSIALDTSGRLYGWGFGTGSGFMDSISRSNPTQLVASETFSKIFGGHTSSSHHYAAISNKTGVFWTWGWAPNMIGQSVINVYNTMSPAPIVDSFLNKPTKVDNNSWIVASAGASHTAAIRSDGKLFTWGLGTSGQLAKTINPVTKLAGSFAIRSDGSAFAWGVNSAGQVGDVTTVNKSSPTAVGTTTLLPGGNPDTNRSISFSSFSLISAGTDSKYAILTDNTLWSWGNNNTGQLGSLPNSFFNRSAPVQIFGSWGQVAGGVSTAFAIDTNNKLFSWGYNQGQLGYLTSFMPIGVSSPTQIGTSSWIQVSSGNRFTLAIKSDNTLWGWGANANGELGNITLGTTYSWTQINYGGGTFVLLIRSDGKLFGLGNTRFGVFGNNTSDQVTNTSNNSPVLLGSTSFSQIEVGLYNSFAIKSDNTLWAWGGQTSNLGQVGTGDTIGRSTPVQIAGSWSQISSSNTGHTLGICSDGSLYAWGNNSYGELGEAAGTIIYRSSPVQIGTSSWTQLSTGNNFSMAIDINNKLHTWGLNTLGQLGRSKNISWTKIAIMGAIRSDGMIFKWGHGNGGLGDLTQNSASSPAQIGTNSWSQLSVGSTYTVAIRADGTLWSWGLNGNGQLGQGDTVPRSSPVQLGTSSWSQVAAAVSTGNVVFAIKADGTMWGWGSNIAGSLGLGDAIARSNPTQINGSWSKVASGTNASIGIKSDGTLWTWGTNSQGQLGTGLTTSRSSPVQIGTGSWAQVTMGTQNAAAITNDGKLFTWGLGTYGALALGDTLSRSSPVQVGTSSWSQVAAEEHMVATDSTGRLLAWGRNQQGQLGINSTIDRSIPMTVGASDLAYGSSYSFNGSSYFKTTNALPTIATNSDYTVEAWIYPTALNAGGPSWIVMYNASTPSTTNFMALTLSAGSTTATVGLWFIDYVATRLNSTTTVSLNVWTHLAVVRSGNVHRIYINGVSEASTYSSGTSVLTNTVSIGYYSGSANGFFTGYISNLRIVNGTAIYTSNFNTTLGSNSVYPTPTSLSGVNLITCITTSIADYSSSANALTNSGITTTTSFSPPLTAISPAVITATAVAAQIASGAALDTSGMMWNWGWNIGIGTGDFISRSNPVQLGTSIPTFLINSDETVGTSSWTQLSAGASFAIGTLSNNTLYAWGQNDQSQLGQNDTINRSSPVQIGTSSWSSIAAGSSHAIGVTSTGQAYGWGLNSDGQLGFSATDFVNRSTPTQITGYTSGSWLLAAAGGADSYLIDTSYSAWSAGADLNGQLGVGGGAYPPYNRGSFTQIGSVSNTDYKYSPIQIGTSSWSQIGSMINSNHVLALDISNNLYTWGRNANGQLGLGDTVSRSSPVQLSVSFSVAQIATGGSVSAALSTTGSLYQWGFNTQGQLGLGDIVARSSPTQVGTSSWTIVSVGDQFTVAAGYNSSGEQFLAGWGLGTSGQIGDSTIVSKSTPAVVSNIGMPSFSSPVQVGTSSWTNVEAGFISTIATKIDSTLWSWGSNTDGRLGINNTLNRSSPVQIGTSSYTLVSIGGSHATATSASNPQTLYAWGLGTSGQLGGESLYGLAVSRSSPVQVAANSLLENKSSPVQVTAGSYSNYYKSSPVQVGTSSWTKVSTGIVHTLGVTTTGTLFSWGDNSNGELGNSDTLNRSSPVQVGVATSISAGNNFSMTITSDGTAYGFGNNNNGQLGDGT